MNYFVFFQFFCYSYYFMYNISFSVVANKFHFEVQKTKVYSNFLILIFFFVLWMGEIPWKITIGIISNTFLFWFAAEWFAFKMKLQNLQKILAPRRTIQLYRMPLTSWPFFSLFPVVHKKRFCEIIWHITWCSKLNCWKIENSLYKCVELKRDTGYTAEALAELKTE